MSRWSLALALLTSTAGADPILLADPPARTALAAKPQVALRADLTLLLPIGLAVEPVHLPDDTQRFTYEYEGGRLDIVARELYAASSSKGDAELVRFAEGSGIRMAGAKLSRRENGGFRLLTIEPAIAGVPNDTELVMLVFAIAADNSVRTIEMYLDPTALGARLAWRPLLERIAAGVTAGKPLGASFPPVLELSHRRHVLGDSRAVLVWSRDGWDLYPMGPLGEASSCRIDIGQTAITGGDSWSATEHESARAIRLGTRVFLNVTCKSARSSALAQLRTSIDAAFTPAGAAP
jgi:hypothetical protein